MRKLDRKETSNNWFVLNYKLRFQICIEVLEYGQWWWFNVDSWAAEISGINMGNKYIWV